ncbi:MAG: hypothetical protein Q9159_001835 [Coniocarpon cinnabarinum]
MSYTNTTTATTTSFAGLHAVPASDPSLSKSLDAMIPRNLQTHFLANEQSEGAGARVRRSIGTPKLKNFSPFLMLDHFRVAKGAGFPDHPHRGQETITYMLKGKTDHEDFAGHKGTLEEGDLQFMTAGRGIVHAEMPRHELDPATGDYPPVEGMQLWVDLPKNLKQCEPRYRDLKSGEIPSVSMDEGRVGVKIISGMANGTESLRELAYTPVWLLDVNIRPGGTFKQQLPSGFNAFAYVIKGSVQVTGTANDTHVPTHHNAVFEQAGDGVVIGNDPDADEAAQLILVAGLPLDQKIVQYGPFVLNSPEEVYQAIADYQGYTNGFERAANWESEIGRRMVR